eukprot:TRINITY_DN11523_c0_g1_i1.p1 TRINITY_DN11523_c0_g1~~TRINITY_DN11523_c0_g1_i1.p1  ORF type:complete len:411 (-),score=101.41 TRINITY_DN11523_c0_g1_i1:20-1231(-)
MQGENRALVMIPGPIEFTSEVLRAVGSPAYAHTDPDFIQIFSRVLKQLRKVFVSEKGQPFVISGSGTLGWDMVAVNLCEAGDNALVVSAGYFGDGFADCLRTYGANVTVLQPPTPGDSPSLAEIEKNLKQNKFRLITVTHVDTSTGVKSDIRAIADLVSKVSPDTFVIADCVCATGAEELLMDAWKVDAIVTASQKALGVPPGLSIAIASPRAINFVSNVRKSPVANYYANWNRWLPIMKSYEACQPSYFATPAVNLICGMDVSLSQILGQSGNIQDSWRAHEVSAKAVKEALLAIGLKTIPVRPELQSNALSTIWLPETVNGDKLRGEMKKRGIVVAGGLYKDIKTKYFRIGHMGKSVTSEGGADIVRTLEALEESLIECGYNQFEKGTVVKIFQERRKSKL